jgi:hypothetical protein
MSLDYLSVVKYLHPVLLEFTPIFIMNAGEGIAQKHIVSMNCPSEYKDFFCKWAFEEKEKHIQILFLY